MAALDSYDELSEQDVSTPAERTAQQLGAAERRELEARLAWVSIEPSARVPASVALSLDAAAPASAERAVAPRRPVQGQPKNPSQLALWGRGALYGGLAAPLGFGVMLTGGGWHSTPFTVGAGGMIVGGVSLMTGAVLSLIDAYHPAEKEAPPEPRRLQVQPWVSSSGAGVSGAF